MKENNLLKLLLLLCIICVCERINAQNIKFGKVSKEDLANKVCESDLNAYAEVLYERGHLEIVFEKNHYVSRLKVFRRIKIYNKNAYHYANVDIPFNKRSSRVSGLKACTYNLVNGNVLRTKLRSRDVFIENLIDDRRQKKFALKDIKEGSIIEFQYIITTSLESSLLSWTFQDEIPVRRSDLIVRIPEQFKFKEYLSGYEKVKRSISSTSVSNKFINVYSYEANNVPAFVDESFIDCREDYISKIEFELSFISFPNGGYKSFSSNWNAICESLKNNLKFGEVFKNRKYFKDILNTISLEGLDNDAKARKIFSYIRDNYKWNTCYYFCSNKSLKSVSKDKVGNSAALNLLMIALMRTAGFECNPVILSTRSNGRINLGSPRLSNYNHTIACLQYGNKKIYLDATDIYSSFDILDCEDKGNMLIIKKNRYEEFCLYNKKISSKLSRITAKLDDNGVLRGSNIFQKNNYYAINFRRNFYTEEKRIEDLQDMAEDCYIDSYKLENLKDKEKPICEKYTFCNGEDNHKPSFLYLPALLQCDNLENPFKLVFRKFPVDFPFIRNEIFNVTIELPSNYEVKQLPKSVISYLQDKSLVFKYSCKQIGNKLSIICSTCVLKIMFMSSEYEVLKSIFDIIANKKLEKIILRLKE